MKLTSKKVENYMKWRTDGIFNHCPIATSKACNELAEKYNNEFGEEIKALDLVKLLFFNDPIPQLHTHSYGFNTATGRNIIETLKYKYYKYEKN
jgi:hypothetical protein